MFKVPEDNEPLSCLWSTQSISVTTVRYSCQPAGPSAAAGCCLYLSGPSRSTITSFAEENGAEDPLITHTEGHLPHGSSVARGQSLGLTVAFMGILCACINIILLLIFYMYGVKCTFRGAWERMGFDRNRRLTRGSPLLVNMALRSWLDDCIRLTRHLPRACKRYLMWLQ